MEQPDILTYEYLTGKRTQEELAAVFLPTYKLIKDKGTLRHTVHGSEIYDFGTLWCGLFDDGYTKVIVQHDNGKTVRITQNYRNEYLVYGSDLC